MRQEKLSDRHKRGLLLGRLVKSKREAAGLSQAEFTRQTGLNPAYVSRLECGEFYRPGPEVLLALVKFGVSIDDLYAVTGCLVPTDLPSFSVYLHTKHPKWPDAVIDELTDYYDFVRQKYSLH